MGSGGRAEDPRDHGAWRSRIIGLLFALLAAACAAAYALERSTAQGLGLSSGWIAVTGLAWIALSTWALARRRLPAGEAVVLDVLAIAVLALAGLTQPAGPWTWLIAACAQLVPVLAAPTLRRWRLVVVSTASCAVVVLLVDHHDAPTLMTVYAAVSMVLLTLVPVATVWFLVRRLDQLTAVAERAATTDELTQLLNRYGLRRATSAALARTAAGGRSLCVVLADLDHFKSVNDVHGHLVGDRVLVAAAAALRTSSRADDLVVRLGGEELGVIAAAASLEEARETAERLRRAVESVSVEGLPRITASFGVALADPGVVRRVVAAGAEDALTGLVSDLLDAADGALYAAKRGGRNRVRVAGEDVGASGTSAGASGSTGAAADLLGR